MPRIPEGKFRTEPSTRVGSIKPIGVESQGSKLRQISKQAGAIGSALEKAEQRVQSMKFAGDTEKEWEEKELPVIDNLFSASKSGFLKKGTKLEDGTVIAKDIKLEDEVARRVSEFQTRKLAGSTDPEADAMYAKYISPMAQKKIAEATKYAGDAIVKDTISNLVSQGEVLRERVIDGDASISDINKWYNLLMDNELVIGKDNFNKLMKGFQQALGARADQIVLNHPEGLSQAKINEAMALTNNLPEAVRRESQRRITKAVDRRKEIEHNRRIEGENKVTNNITDPITLGAASNQVQKMKHSYLKSPRAEYETPQMRVNGYTKLESRVAAIEIMSEVGHLDPRSPEFNAKVTDRINASFRDIASSEMIKYADEAGIKSLLVSKVQTELNSMVQSRKDNPRAFQKKFQPSLELQLSKNNPDAAVPQIIEMQQAWGIAGDSVILADANDAKNDKKAFKAMRGGEDPDGSHYLNFMAQNNQRWGKYAYKMYKDSAAFKSGGVDPSIIYASEVSDTKMQRTIAKGHGNFEANIQYMTDKGLIAKDSGDRYSGNTVENKFVDMVKTHVADNGVSYDALYFGPNNHARYDGYIKSVTYMSGQYVRGGMDIDDAIELAHNEMRDEFPSAHDGQNMISVTKAYAQDRNINTEELGGMLDDAKEMKYIADMGIQIDFDKMKEFTKNNPKWAGKMAGIAGKSYDPSEQIENFVDEMGDNIIVTTDPNEPNKIKFYMTDPKTGEMSPIPIVKDGKSKQLTIDADSYFNHYNTSFFDKRGTKYGGIE
jgi:hypothetical protein